MIVKPGKYLTRSGELIAEVEVTDMPGEIYPVRGRMRGRHEWWTANGRYYNNGKEHASDLVTRIPDDAPQPSSPEPPPTRRERFAMIIKPGKYLTRDKSIALVRAIEPTGGKHPVLGIINGLGGISWTSSGYYYNGGAKHPLDLISRLDDEAPSLSLADEYRPLTRRERFAMAAMQGFVANPSSSASFEGFAEDAVRQADALIAALDKGVDQ